MDDHPRNHGFHYDSKQGGWCLSPAYDINPVPPDVKARYLSTLINERDGEASFDLVLSTGEYYGLTAADMRQIVKRTVDAVLGWRAEAAKTGISRKEVARMAVHLNTSLRMPRALSSNSLGLQDEHPPSVIAQAGHQARKAPNSPLVSPPSNPANLPIPSV